MDTRLRRTTLAGAALAAVLAASAAGANAPTQTNWTIVSATGTTLFTVDGSDGPATYTANIRASWRQKPTSKPGVRTVSIPFKTIPNYVAANTLFRRNPIYGIVGSVSGSVSVQAPEASGACDFAMSKLPRTFFSGSGANDLFLDYAKSGGDLIAFVNGQDAGGTFVDAPECDSLPFGPPRGVDQKRERIKRISLALLKPAAKGKKVTLVIHRTAPVVGTRMKVVGQVTEKAKITLRYDSGF
jgi:hypothetical protein